MLPGLGRRDSVRAIDQAAMRPVKARLASMILVVVPLRMVMLDPVMPVRYPPIAFVPHVILIIITDNH